MPGLLLVVAFVAAWIAGTWAFGRFVMWVTSLFPHVGRRHRHDRWDDLNRIESRKPEPPDR